MKILHVISSSGMYGAEAVILNLALTMKDGEHSCVLCIFDNAANPNHQLWEAARSAGIEASLIPCSGRFDRSTITSLQSLAAFSQADVVHAHGYKADIYSWLALRHVLPLVSTCHTWYDTDRMVTLYGAIDRLVLRGFTAVVAVSDQVRQRLLNAGVRSNRISLVRNGIDLRPFEAPKPSLREELPPGTLLVGLIGRLAWEKGVDIYLQAVSRIREEFPQAQFVVVGEGPDRDQLQELADSLHLGQSVTFLGRRDDMPSVYASLDLMVSASRLEGLPMALLEGMASKLPVVATAVGEVPSLICGGVNGVLVPPEDAGALARAMAELLRQPERRAQLSKAARVTVASEYAAERMVQDYERIYREAIAVRPLRPAKEAATQQRMCARIFMMDLWATVPYYTAYLSRALLAEGANVQVGSITYYLDPQCYSSRGIRLQPGCMDRVGRFPLSRWPRRVLKLAESLLNLAALSVRFAANPPKIVHVQFLPMLTSRLPIDLWFVRYCQARGSRIVLTVHDLLPHDSGQTHKAVYRALYARMDALICHSPSIQDRLIAEFDVSREKIAVIPHGPFFYDLRSAAEKNIHLSLDIPEDDPMVLWQGIIFPYKGVDILLQAWEQVESQSPKGHLVIIGTGDPDLLDKIRRQVAQLHLQRVRMDFRFVATDELVAAYRAAAIVTYPYRAITTSGALATGLALGKTIVASDLPVFREVLSDRENALLFQPPAPGTQANEISDADAASATALAAALIELLGDPELREQLAGQVRAMNFGDETWRSIAAQTIATYRSVIRRTSQRKTH
jgi:glycosyltransferase involved in cell wall biosynthesis